MQSYRVQPKYLFLFVIFLHMTYVSGSNDTCGCYMLGTLGSIDGESMCDNKTLQCRCYPNVIGKNCTQCGDGFYNILSGHGCSSCRCSPLGSVNKSCDALTGQCQCKTGFTGFQCDQCELNAYKFTYDKCQNCNCNPYGSKDPQCNIVGRCPCLPNAEGTLCDHCKENTYSIEQGCLPCPPCYGFVQSAIKNHTEYLNTIEEKVDEIENNLPLLIQDYRYFFKEIKFMKAKIEKLRLQYEGPGETVLSEDAINKLTEEAEDFHNEVLNLIQQFDNDLYRKKIKNAWYMAHTNLTEANDLLKVCEEALENATITAKSHKRHNKTMTLIAKNALATSQKIEDDAEEYYQLSVSVNTTCKETCSTAEEYHKKQQALNTELKNVESDILNTTNGVKAMKTYLEGFHEKTKISKEEALRLYEHANLLLIPNTDKISDDLQEINDNLTSINQTIKNLTNDFNTIQENEKSTENHMQSIQDKQKIINNNFTLVQSYDERATVAINKSNDVLESTQESLKNLQKFNEIKKAAEAAMRNMPDIRAKVDAVLNNSNEIENIFGELSTAIKDLEKQQQKLNNISQMNEKDNADVAEKLKLLEELEEEDRQLSQKLEESQGKLKAIKRNLNDLQKDQIDIERSIARMQEYILVLNTLPTSEEQLDEVEEEIKTMEDMVLATEYLMGEKQRLQKEVDNIKDIIESIPIDDSSLCESAKSEPKTI